MSRLFSILVLSLTVSLAHACPDDPRPRPLSMVGNSAHALLENNDFAALDKMAQRYRKPDSLAVDGQPNIVGMYDGLSNLEPCGTKASDEQWATHAKLLAQWRAASPTSTAARLASATFELQSGWHARGGEPASQVSEQQWSEMRAHVAHAHRQLDALPRSARNDPQWYRLALQIAFAEGQDMATFDRMFNEGIKRFPNSYTLYVAKAHYLDPKWYGSTELQRQFIEASGRNGSAIAPILYTRLVLYATDENPFKSFADWPRMRAGFEALLEKYPTSLERNQYANYACVTNDVPVLQAQLALLGSGLDAETWNGGAHSVQLCQARAEGKKCYKREDTGATICL